MFGLDKSLIRWDKLIGAGTSGDVYEYGDDSKWVVKRIVANTIDKFISIIPELVLGFSCNHESFLKLQGFRVERDKKLFIMYIRFHKMKETLREKLDRNKANNQLFTKEEVIKYFHTLACVIEYLHNKNIYHRDIKPENILIDYQGNPVIADIGEGRFVPEEELDIKMSMRRGTEHYAAPEIVESNSELTNKYLEQADAWSLGMVMAEMCLVGHKELKRDHDQKLEIFEAGYKAIEQRYDKILAKIISGLLDFNLSERKTVQETRKLLESFYYDILGIEEVIDQIKSKIMHSPKKQGLRKKEKEESHQVTPGGDNFILEQVDEEEEQKSGAEEEEMKPFSQDQLPVLNEVKKEVKKAWEELIEFRTGVPFGVTIPLKNQEKVKDETMIEFAEDVVRRLKENGVDNLEKFGLEFASGKNLSDVGIQEMTHKLISNLQNLQMLLLNFTSCENLTDQGIENLSACIGKRARHLKHLSLNFRNCIQVTDKGINALTSQIQDLNKIQSLTLQLGDCKNITDSSLIDISNLISNNMQFLSFDFANCNKISDQGIQQLVSCIGKSASTLDHLSLVFSGCALKEFLNQMNTSFPKLKHFSMDVSACNQLSAVGIKYLALHIGTYFKHLQRLHLTFSNCEVVTDQGLKVFGDNVEGELSRLKFLSLDLSGCRNITDEGLKILSGFLCKLPSEFIHLSLNFACCNQISWKGLEEISDKIVTKIVDLQKFTLNIQGCEKIDSKGVSNLKNKLEDIPSLDIITDHL